MPKKIYKSFPANPKLDIQTFLNDPKINAELYGYLLVLSKGAKTQDGKGITYIDDKEFPSASNLSKKLGKCRQTISKHLEYLKERQYLQRDEINHQWIILNPEKFYYNIPTDTLAYLLDTVQNNVLKVYVYLGNRYDCSCISSSSYTFTNKELCEHLGLQYRNNYDKIKHIIDALEKYGLIQYSIIANSQGHPYMKLHKVSKEIAVSDKAKSFN